MKLFKSFQSVVNFSVSTRKSEEYDCDIDLEVLEFEVNAYSVHISNREFTFYTDIGTFTYLVDMYGDAPVASLHDWELDESVKIKGNPTISQLSEALKDYVLQVERLKELMKYDRFEVYVGSYSNQLSKDQINIETITDDKIFFTSDLFRYTDYGGAYTIAKANIQYINENYQELIDQELIESYGTAYNGENMEFSPQALLNDDLFDELKGLDGYPVLDDQTLSEVEMEIEQECWDSYGRDDFKNVLENEFDVELSDEKVDEIAYEAAQYTSSGFGHVEAMQFYFDTDSLLDAVKEHDLMKGVK